MNGSFKAFRKMFMYRANLIGSDVFFVLQFLVWARARKTLEMPKSPSKADPSKRIGAGIGTTVV